MYKGFKVRIYPNEEQEKLMKYYCYCNRKMWNYVVAKFKDEKVSVNKFGIKGYKDRDLLNDMEVEYGLTNIPQKTARNVLTKYAQTMKMFFKQPGVYGKPKFHKYNPNKQSFRACNVKVKVKNNSFQLSKNKKTKLKTARIPINEKYLQKFPIEEIIEPTYTCIRGKWYLSGTYKVEKSEREQSQHWLGFDWGIKNFYTDSNGNTYNYPSSVLRQFQRINKLKSYRDKKQRGSKNYNKIKLKIEKAYERFENLKRDFIEQTTARLSESNVVIEDLTNAKIKQSNKNRRRLQLLAPRTRFNERLKQKCESKNNVFVEVSPAYSSRTCSVCGKVKEAMPTSVRIFECNCGYIGDRDLNAAINIVARGGCASLISL